MCLRRLLTLCALLAAGCTSTPPDRLPTPKPPPRQPAASVPPTPQTYLESLLARARDALGQLKLTTPPGDNAYDYYQQVLEIDPANREARAGLERIVERYLDLAAEAQDAGQFQRSEQLLARAESVMPGHPGIAHAKRRGESLQRGTLDTIALDADALSGRQRGIRNRLFHLGVTAKNAGQRVIIVARNDAEGRWVYQQMNAAPGPRLRGELRLGATPSVTLQQLAR